MRKRRPHRQARSPKRYFVHFNVRAIRKGLLYFFAAWGMVFALAWFDSVDEWAMISALFMAVLFVLTRVLGSTPTPILIINEETDPQPVSTSDDKDRPGPSKSLRKAVGPIARELHKVEEELLSQTAVRTLDGPQLVSLSRELASIRAELIEDSSPEHEPDPRPDNAPA